jgi:hypothetical protein
MGYSNVRLRHVVHSGYRAGQYDGVGDLGRDWWRPIPPLLPFRHGHDRSQGASWRLGRRLVANLRNLVRNNETLGEIDEQPGTGGGGDPGWMRCQGRRGAVVGLDVWQAANSDHSVGRIYLSCGDYEQPTKFANKLPSGADGIGQSAGDHTSICGVGLTRLRQAQPRAQLSPRTKLVSIAHRCDQRCSGYPADPFDRHQTNDLLIVTREPADT